MAPKSGRYRISVDVDDGVRLRLNGKLVLDKWNQGKSTYSLDTELTENPCPIRLEFKNAGGPGSMSLRWELAGVLPDQPIPMDALFHDETVARASKVGPGDGSRRLKGHTEKVWSVAYSPDGTRLLSASDDRTARLWDPVTAKEVRRFGGHEGPVYIAVFTPDGRVITAGADCCVRLWDPATGRELKKFAGHSGFVTCLAVSPDGRQFLSGSDDSTARLWDLRTGKEIYRCTGHTASVRGVAIFPGGKRAVTGSEDGTVRIWALPKEPTNKN
jgi:WD40 repeat protein